MIDRVTVEKILDAANIVDVVSDFVTLKRAGANLKGLCPFHDDRTPSFMVSPAKNYCKCFACGEGGTPIGFIMKHENLSYPDALKYLAKKYGIEIQEKELTQEEMQSRNDRDSMFIVNEWARDWFRNQLHNTQDGKAIGLAYFRNRGFQDDIIEKFQLGFCPDGKTNTMGADALKEGYLEKYLVNTINENEPQSSIGTGLCIKNDNGQLRDRFRGRVIWPIFTVSGRVAGFGGRVLDSATKGVNVKYLNSPESITYSKRKELFGLYQAKEAIRKQDLCYLVEGYTDVMAMHQHGVANVVASSGTALTTNQIQLIHRMTNNLTVIFDGDEAGIHASERGIDMILAEGMNVKLLLLPDGEDPDSFGRKHNATEYQEYLKEHQVDFIHYKTNRLLENAQNDPAKLGKLIHNVTGSIAVIPDEIIRVLYIRQAAKILNMEERLITKSVNERIQELQEEKQRERERAKRMLTETRPNTDTQQPKQDEREIETLQPASTKTIFPRETVLMEMIMKHGEKIICETEGENEETIPISVAEYIFYSMKDDNIEFSTPLYQEILKDCLLHKKEDGFAAEKYFANHPNPAINELAFKLCVEQIPLSKYHEDGTESSRLDEIIPNLIAGLKLEIVQRDLKELIERTKNPELKNDKEAFQALMREFNEKSKLAKELAKECGERVILK